MQRWATIRSLSLASVLVLAAGCVDQVGAGSSREDDIPGLAATAPAHGYTTIDQHVDDRWATYIAVAFGDRALDDRQLLDLFSARYADEHDALRKRAIAASELAPIKARVATFRTQRYYAIAFGTNDPHVVDPRIELAGAYDANDRSFPLTGDCGGGRSWQRNAWGAVIEMGGAPALCRLSVTDPGSIRAIEALREAHRAHLGGVIRFVVRGVDGGNRIAATPTGIDYEVRDEADARLVATIEQRP